MIFTELSVEPQFALKLVGLWRSPGWGYLPFCFPTHCGISFVLYL